MPEMKNIRYTMTASDLAVQSLVNCEFCMADGHHGESVSLPTTDGLAPDS